jgi:DNA repair protein RadC
MARTKYNTTPVFSLKLVREHSIKYPVDKVDCSNMVVAAMQAYLGDKDCEHLAVILLDYQHNMLGIATVSIGTLGTTTQGIRDVFKHAIAGRAGAIVLSHCHPSSDVTPSNQDIAFTNKAYEASKILGIPILDHVIVSSGIKKGYFSFLDHGLIKEYSAKDQDENPINVGE